MAEKSGEFRGKTVEAAISNGLAALGLTRDQVEIEVVRPGSRGLLGIGAEDAVVRLTGAGSPRPEPRPEPPARAEAPAAPRPESRPPSRPEPRPAPRNRGASRTETAASPTETPVEPARAERASAPSTDAVTLPAAGARTGDPVERGQEILQRLLDYMNLRAQVEVVPQSEVEAESGEHSTVLNIVGEDLGMLIGRQSEVLSALQFLTRLMINQQSRGRTNLVVDVNGYKSKRAESLRKLALRTAEQVLQTGRTMALEPMPPAERRVVHLTLRDHPGVTTQSVGEGSKRKVTVIPKKS